MRKAIFLVGFNNWGKSTIIRKLFKKKSFKKNSIHVLGNNKFIVHQSSNDDLKGIKYTSSINQILGNFNSNDDLFTTLCPSMESENNFINILSDNVFNIFDEFHFLLLEYKWEKHAKLIIDNIEQEIRSNLKTNVNIITIKDKEENLKLDQIKQEIEKIYY